MFESCIHVHRKFMNILIFECKRGHDTMQGSAMKRDEYEANCFHSKYGCIDKCSMRSYHVLNQSHENPFPNTQYSNHMQTD